ncbi:MAG TPA: NAD(P)/FAD-dependent oxidoreductase [Patescibacteria group bacterium]|nr:NAD(P)/FAD-dependent oxidoreductase [Patescibacteria group bacterium]
MTKTVHIVGAGLVGPLMAIYLAKKGFDVQLHERRGDMRKGVADAGRSINLAITSRGWRALEDIGLKGPVSEISIPMHGRMVHDVQGNTILQPYGQKESEVIYAASRSHLNAMLLDAAETHKNVKINFGRKCTGYQPDKDLLSFEDANIEAPVVIAADGAWSAVRKSLMAKIENFDYAQSFQKYGYKELEIPPGAGGAFRIERHALHIWPRKSYMMIALPNTEGSFTCTLFFPYEGNDSFQALKTPGDVAAFFAREFPDAAAQMPRLTEDFFANPTGSLVTIKCAPWHYEGKALLIGDAAHAIVPFFAQGMNSGFEDCAALDALITTSRLDWEKVFAAFSRQRKPNTDAIADMAVENFIEMRDSVSDPVFQLKKKVGFELEKRFPGKFIPRYSMVIFHPEIPYAEARDRGERQDKILDQLCRGVTAPEQVNWELAAKLIAS